jgi:hypothetical protein
MKMGVLKVVGGNWALLGVANLLSVVTVSKKATVALAVKVMTILLLVLGFTCIASAQKFDVKVINRQDSTQSYSYATFYNGQAAGAEFQVTGATLTLQLPDGRAAVVNCAAKFQERFAGPVGNRRSCRVPLVDEFQAEFHGGSARLSWNVSLDGKKSESETYKILAIVAASKP